MKRERGGTFLGFVIGVVVGLGAALAVAVFVTKVPIQFMNKGQSRSAEQDAAEAKKNKDWDPNAPLYGKNPAKTTPPAVAVAPADTAPAVAAPAAVAKTDTKPAPKAEPAPAVAADPLGDLAKAKMASTEPFSYFVQVGAFRTLPDAEGQRAKLSLSGVETKISEREQSGAMVYRVRVGPFDKKDEAERAKEKLESSGIETALVRVQR